MQTLDRIRAWAETFPDRTAYCSPGGSLTYGALWAGAARLSSALRALPEDRMILFGAKEPEMVIGILGCLLAGKTYIPLSDDTPSERVQRIAEAIRPCRLLTAGKTLPGAASLRIGRLLKDPPPAASAWARPADRPAYIIFTSGSTGVPKGVPISRGNLDHFVRWISGLEPLRLEPPARVLNQARFSFDLSVADLYFSLCGGHTLYALPADTGADPARLTEYMRDSRIEAAVCTPTFLKLCLIDPEFKRGCLPSLRVVYSCGETLEPGTARKLLQRFPDLRLLNAYGPTEATSAVCAAEITAAILEENRPLPVGELDHAACEITLTDGEITLKGNSVFSGYFDGSSGGYYEEGGRPCFRTGDLGWIEGNRLYCKGRRDRQIKWKGYRIELDEIEQTILTVPGVTNAAVCAKRNEEGVVRLIKAFVVLESGMTAEALRQRLRNQLPPYMIPKSITETDAIPINANGKIDRKRLEEL